MYKKGEHMEKNDTNAALRAHSRQSILQLIQQNGTISRAELARRLELSRSTVSENIAPLLQCGVLQEVGTAHAQRVGGRRPVLLQIQGDYCYFVAAELGLEQPIFALSDLNGRQLYRQILTVRDSAPYEERLQQSIAAVSTLLRQGNVPPGHLAMIALSSPGAFSGSDEQFLLNPEFENWDVRRLIDDLERHFQTHVLWVNDINAATVGEYYQGAGQRVSNLLFMGCGMGIGMGMILDGKLYTGSRGSAGEIARVRVGRLNTPLRTQVEIPSLMDRIRMEAPPATRAAFRTPMETWEFQQVVQLWRNGDPFLHALVEDIGRALGEILITALSLLNCARGVLGGDDLVFESQLLPLLNQAVQREAFDPVEVVSSSLRQEAGLYGLISMAVEQQLQQIAMER